MRRKPLPATLFLLCISALAQDVTKLSKPEEGSVDPMSALRYE